MLELDTPGYITPMLVGGSEVDCVVVFCLLYVYMVEFGVGGLCIVIITIITIIMLISLFLH